MMEAVYHLRVKEERAARIIEELIEADAVEDLRPLDIDEELSTDQKIAVDAELEKIAADKNYLVEWDSTKGRFKKS